MNTFRNIIAALLIGLLCAGAVVGLYWLSVALLWLGQHGYFMYGLAIVIGIGGAGLYLMDNA